MISFFLENAQSIIIAIIFIVIIEMLLPNNANKKYIKVVSGIYLIITIINPFLKILNKDFQFDFSENLKSIETSSDINLNLKEYYLKSLKETMKAELSKQGYIIYDLNVDFNEDYSEIYKIEVLGAKSYEIENIRKYFCENYSIESDKIIFL